MAAQNQHAMRLTSALHTSACDMHNHLSGAELAGLCREAAVAALREDLDKASQVAARHFTSARAAKPASLTPAILKEFEDWMGRRK